MKFKKINELKVNGPDGSWIQIKNHDYLEYGSDIGVVQITVGYDPAKREIVVYASEAKTRETPSGTEDIPASEHQVIVDDLKEGLALLKGKFIVV